MKQYLGRRLTALTFALAVPTGTVLAAHADYHLGPVVVTATRTEERVQDAPAAVQVVTRHEMTDRGASTLGEALAAIPGVQLSIDAKSRSHVNLRGMENRHTLILVDGQRIGGDINQGAGNAHVLERIGVQDVERIEVVQGAASALYGSDAVGGVINIITRRSQEPSLSLRGSYGSFSDGAHGQYDYGLRYDSGSERALRYRISYGALHQAPHSNGRGGSLYYYGTARPLAVSAEYMLSEQAKVGALYRRTVHQQYVDGGYKETKPGAPKQFRDDTDNRTVTTTAGAYYEGNNGEARYRLDLQYTRYTKDYATFSRAREITGVDYTRHTTAGAAFRYDWQPLGSHRPLLGAEYRTEEGISTRIGTTDPAGMYQRGDYPAQPLHRLRIKYRSAYLQDTWEPSSRWRIIPALRLDSSDAFGSQWSPKLGAIYRLRDDLRIKANVGRGYVTPRITELAYRFMMFQEVFMGPRVGYVDSWWIGNPDLRPETSVSYDISVEKDFAAGQVRATLFRQQLHDYIHYRRIKVEKLGQIQGFPHQLWTYRYENGGEATVQGAELAGEWRIGTHWEMRFGYNYLDARNGAGERLYDRARHKVDLGTYYHGGNWSAALWGSRQWSYLSSFAEEARPEAFGVWNANVGYTWNNGLRLYTTVENLFNANRTERTFVGRGWRIGMEYTW